MDDWLDVKEGGLLTNRRWRNRGGEQPEKEAIDDNDYAALDAETMKQRDWDEFTEANPRGWGKIIIKVMP